MTASARMNLDSVQLLRDRHSRSKVLLSICIPTHNGRARSLRDVIESILSQIASGLSGDVEVCISDNASQDGTADLLRGYREKYPGLFRVNRNDRDEGFEPNLLKSVELANGDYCWLFSSDDQLVAGSIDKVIHLLAQQPNLAGVSVNRVNYDRDMTRESWQDPAGIYPVSPEWPHRYDSADQALQECGVVFTYASSQIVCRGLWREVVDAYGANRLARYRIFPHLFVIAAMVARRPAWLWFPDKLVKNRVENDSLVRDLDDQIFLYRLATMKEISQIWMDLLGRGSPQYRVMMTRFYRLWWNGAAVRRQVKLTPRHSFRGDVSLLVGSTRQLYFLPEFWRDAFPALLTPYWVVRFQQYLRDRLHDLKVALNHSHSL